MKNATEIFSRHNGWELPNEFWWYNLDFLGGFFIKKLANHFALVGIYKMSGDLLDYYKNRNEDYYYQNYCIYIHIILKYKKMLRYTQNWPFFLQWFATFVNCAHYNNIFALFLQSLFNQPNKKLAITIRQKISV